MLLRLFFGLVAVISDGSASPARSTNSESQGASMDTGVGSGDAADVPDVPEAAEVPMVPEARDDNAPNDPEPEAPELPLPGGSPWRPYFGARAFNCTEQQLNAWRVDYCDAAGDPSPWLVCLLTCVTCR